MISDLFARARALDPPTSHFAAAKVPRFENTHYAKIMNFIDTAKYPATYEQIANATGMERHQVARRLPELEKLGRVRRMGYGTLANGNRAQLWGAA